CWSRTSSVVGSPTWTVSRPHDHCTVPAPKTSAFETGSRYSTRLWVAVPLPYVLPLSSRYVPSVIEMVVDDRSIAPVGRFAVASSTSHSYPRVPSGNVADCPLAIDVLRHSRRLPYDADTGISSCRYPLARKSVPVSWFVSR